VKFNTGVAWPYLLGISAILEEFIHGKIIEPSKKEIVPWEYIGKDFT
jgi:hypothetical protein